MRRLGSRLLGVAQRALAGLSNLLTFTGRAIDLVKLRYVVYEPRPDDLFLVAYPRSGMIWLQMMLYQLTTDGSMEFSHISEVIPSFERLPASGKDLEAMSPPRIFKSHLSYKRIPKGPCRYIYCCRDGRDVAVSCFHYFRAQRRFGGEFEEFFERFMRGKLLGCASWPKHVAGWWAHRQDPNVLFLWYEEAVADLEGVLRRIADFCCLEIDEARFPELVERCSFAFMRQHERQFDPASEALRETGMAPGKFLRKGNSGEGKELLDADQQRQLDEALKKRINMSPSQFREISGRSGQEPHSEREAKLA